MIKVLLNYGADIEERDEYSRTPLHHAATYNMPEIAEMLINLNAKMEARDIKNQTPLHYAAWFKSVEVAQTLMNHLADTNAKDEKDRTPLQLTRESPTLMFREDNKTVERLLTEHM